MATDDRKLPVQEFKLDVDNELRFEVETKNEKVYLTLKSGKAEVFGTELVKGKTYEFVSGAKIAVYTWHSCTIELKGKTDVSYVAKETPMVMYSNCHAALELMRIDAENDNKKGPTCMIVGPTDVGKSTVCRILLNYAVRMGRRPIYVDLDIGQGQISIPGTIGALLVERPATIDEGFSQEAPLVYHQGHKSPQSNVALYNMLITQLANTVKERLEVNKKTRASGVIINTCGWIKGEGYRSILHSIKAFETDIILVLDQERLYNELVRDLPNYVKVVFLQKSGGVVERSKSIRSEARDQRIREYFYGTPKNSMYPHSFDVKWSEIKIFKIGAPALPDSCLPLGMKADDHLTKLVPITPNPGILHHLLAVSFSEAEDDDIILSHVAGFVCVTNVDSDRQTITVLSPQPKPLPNTVVVPVPLCHLSMSNQNLEESNENAEETIEEEESLPEEESIDVVEELRQLSSDFFQKHHSFSFICLEQISSSHSSFFKNLYNFFPPIADPGIDDAFNYQPPEFTIDDVGIENYLRNCKQFGIVPYKRIVDSLKTDMLDLHYYKLSLEQFRAFKDSLKFNKSVKQLILQDNWLSPEQVEIISEILVENVNIAVLNLQECRIGVKGAEKLQEGIMGTFFLRELNLSFNDLTDEGLRFLKDSLIMNNSIKILNLSRNELTDQSALTIQEIITNNKGIEQLDLSWNYLYNGPSNKLMFKTLVDNKQIKWLSLAFNGISAKIGLIPIMKALRLNDTIEFLDLSNNRIANNCVKILKDAIINSESLIEIKVGSNCYQPEQAQILAKSLLDNKFKLSKLDMENTIFNKSFLKLLDLIRATNKTIIYGFILSNYEIIGPDIYQVLFARCNYLAQKPKKKKQKRNFGHFVLQLPDDLILKQDFYNLVAKSKIKLNTELVDELSNNFLVRKTKIDCNRIKMEYLRLYPDTVLPEPKPKKAKKKKKKKAKKV